MFTKIHTALITRKLNPRKAVINNPFPCPVPCPVKRSLTWSHKANILFVSNPSRKDFVLKRSKILGSFRLTSDKLKSNGINNPHSNKIAPMTKAVILKPHVNFIYLFS